MEAGTPPPVPGGFPPVEPTPGEDKPKAADEEAWRAQAQQAATPPWPEPPKTEEAKQSPLDAHAEGGDPFRDRPEVYVGAAFAGGFVLAQILRRFGR